MEKLPEAFAPLRDYNQFILFKYIQTEKAGKFDKVPVDYRTLRNHNPHDPNIWLPADEAISRVVALGNSSSGYGVGFTITDADPFFFLDIDNAYDADAGCWSPTAEQLVGQFNGAAVEVSSSMRGLHILGRGTLPDHRTRDLEGLGLELYHDKRFVALTGTHARGSINFDCSDALQVLVSTHFNLGSGVRNYTEKTPAAIYKFTDEELIEKACSAVSPAAAFGSVITFRQLWEGDNEALCRFFPKDGSFDASSADFSLATHLAFWTERDIERIERLMRISGLYRDKWERQGRFPYLIETIALACSKQSQVYSGGGTSKTKVFPASVITESPEKTHTDKLTENNLNGYVTADQQVSIFKDCVYVVSDNKVFIPSGMLLKEKQFNAVYGGMVFTLDRENTKTTSEAYKALTQTQVVRRLLVQRTCFKPNFPMGTILTINGDTCVNIYKPPKVHRVIGDPTPFLNHLRKLFPHNGDRYIVTSYLAALVQMVGIKFQWCPLIQGMQGNGKSILTYIASYCVGRQYTHFPKAKELDSKFNAWLVNRVLIGVEDMYVSRDRMEVMEALKPMITGEMQGIEGKGVDQATFEIVANFILNTNHKDALYLTKHDRRFACFFTPQQEPEDLKRDGMDGDYFSNLFDWLKLSDGYAICCEFLSTFQISDEFKRSLYSRAPVTSSTAESLQISLGAVEQTILEAIGEERMGFRGNFISSYHLTILMRECNMGGKMKHSSICKSLQLIGYIKHPALNEGRMTTVIHPDPIKARLYVKRDSEESRITSGAEVARVYSIAQGS